ncbi:hypothetical protein ASD83_10705 [Devosia sp. Root685]|uniref:TIGR02444 family protein n=1 Tax=Devosia sp. Root685 TaxID=1736587 RepID=UPI0006F3CB09|nr:TIGR02444 family protein [Devosia sp. Root685]KRA97583.1 hypothetical protein ASD83_10705 [Devosia sp. Root685]
MINLAFLPRVWPDMCAVYRDPGLATACLEVQERFGADVPLLLVLSLADRAGHGIARYDLEALVVDSQSWRETVIEPLRRARQGMKGRFNAPAETGLHDDIKRLELEAERLHVQRLAEAFPPSAANGESTALLYLAMRGLAAPAATEFLKTFTLAYETQVLPALALD